MISIDIVQDDSWLDRCENEWPSLLHDAEFATPFHSLEWHRAYRATWNHRRPFTILMFEGSDLVGAFPLVQCTGAWKTLRAAATGISDYLHPLIRQEYAQEFSNHFSEIAASSNAHLLDLHQIPSDDPLLKNVKPDDLVEQATCLSLKLPSSFEEYVATLSKSMRYEARRLTKSPYANQEASVVWASTEQEATQSLEVFFALHAQRWRKRGLPGAFAIGKLREFHSRFVRAAVEGGILRLGHLKYEGASVGVLYALACARRWFFYQSGFDPAQKALSPGTVLVASAIRQAIAEGATEFDFLRGDEPYKRRWAPQGIRTNCRLLKTLKPPLGMVGQAWNSVGGRIESKLRARLEGRGLLS